MKRRLRALLLAMVMLVSTVAAPIQAKAANDEYGVKVSSSAVHPGDEFDLEISFPPMEQGVNAFQYEVSFNKDVFEVVSYNRARLTDEDGLFTQSGSTVTNANKVGKLTAAYVDTTAEKGLLFEDGFVATAKMRVKADCEAYDAYTFQFEKIVFSENQPNGLTNSVSVNVTVRPVPAESIGVEYESKEIFDAAPGNTFVINAVFSPANMTDEITWASSDTTVATVAADADDPSQATVTAVSTGTANITVTAGDKSAVCAVVVVCQHNYQSVAEIPATCLVDGTAAHYDCSRCNQLFTGDGAEKTKVEAADLVIDKATAAHAFEDVAVVPATCKQDGVAAHKDCTVCHNLFTTAGEPTTEAALKIAKETVAHTYASGVYVTDTEGLGHHWQVCTVCEAATEKVEHSAASAPATCKDKAVCDVCGEEFGNLNENAHASSAISATWSKDATNHWKVCGDCSSQVQKATHDTVSAATCQAKAVCNDCGEYGEFADHNFGTALAYNDDLDAAKHYVSCQTEGCTEKQFTAHTYDQHTVKISDATCEHGNIYRVTCACGKVNPDTENNTWEDVASKLPHTEEGEKAVWKPNPENPETHILPCGSCGVVTVNTEAHSGGTATCTVKAVCTVCAASYGNVDANNHKEASISTEWSHDGQNHWKVCADCTANVQTAAHSGGTATCTEKAECSVCGTAYGPEPVGHQYVAKKDATHHWEECSVCEVEKAGTKVAHSYTLENENDDTLKSTATCQSPAVYYKSCSCGAYGDDEATFTVGTVAEHTNLDGVWTIDADGHWKKCAWCDEKLEEGVHEGGAATCKLQAVCTVCEKPYGELDPDNHTGKQILTDVLVSTEEAEGFTGNIRCEDCAAILVPGEVIPRTIVKAAAIAVSDITADMQSAGITTVAQVQKTLTDKVTAIAGYTAENTVVYDAKCQVFDTVTNTWRAATPTDIPAGGKLSVTIPYPTGVDKDEYDFVVFHMFSSGANAGMTEQPAVIETANGLQFEVTGLSPIAVSWKKTVVPPAPQPEEDDDDEDAQPTQPAAAQTPAKAPKTGDSNAIFIWMAIDLFAVLGVVAVVVRRRKRQ